jgi:hypothetical protein
MRNNLKKPIPKNFPRCAQTSSYSSDACIGQVFALENSWQNGTGLLL